MALEKFPDTLHTIFKSALAAARPEDRPAGPWHLGATVRPVFPARAQVLLAIALARRCSTEQNRRQVEAVLAAVQGYLDGKATGDALRSLAQARTGDDALGIARNAAGAAATLARGKPDLVHTGAQAAAAKAVKLTPAGEPTRALLAALDQEVLCAECEAAFIAAGAPAGQRVGRTLWRGVGANGKAAHFIARLPSGSFAGAFKLARGKATSIVGGLDEVVACVPEGLFASAVSWVKQGEALPDGRLSDLPA